VTQLRQLAIIIPAYKSQFFHQTLSSLANQTNQNFNVYVGDDCSPEDLKNIADQYSDRLNINYTRFSKNIGAKHIVQQWNRCLELVKEEEWIWLFSDDDLMDPNCVKVFYQYLNDYPGYQAYRFNVNRINVEGEIIKGSINYDPIETCEILISNILLLNGGHGLVDHIYNRKALYEKGGFVYTDFAQAADWATSIKMSEPNGLINMREASVYWRMSGFNISSQASFSKRSAMLRGHIQFLNWVSHFFMSSAYFKNTNTNLTKHKLADLLRLNFEIVVNMHYKGISLPNIFKYQKTLAQIFEFTNTQTIRYLMRLYISNNDKAKSIYGFFKGKK
jgi:glycosyltransferase involved in cell wall biosynthesis